MQLNIKHENRFPCRSEKGVSTSTLRWIFSIHGTPNVARKGESPERAGRGTKKLIYEWIHTSLLVSNRRELPAASAY